MLSCIQSKIRCFAVFVVSIRYYSAIKCWCRPDFQSLSPYCMVIFQYPDLVKTSKKHFPSFQVSINKLYSWFFSMSLHRLHVIYFNAQKPVPFAKKIVGYYKNVCRQVRQEPTSNFCICSLQNIHQDLSQMLLQLEIHFQRAVPSSCCVNQTVIQPQHTDGWRMVYISQMPVPATRTELIE